MEPQYTTGHRAAIALAAMALVLLAASCSYYGTTPASPTIRAHRGLLDLRGIDLSKTIVGVNGDWALHWGSLRAPSALSGPVPPAPTGYLTVPGLWNSPAAAAMGVTPQGYATYHLKIIRDAAPVRLTLQCQHIMTAYRLYVNGRLAAAVGIVAARKNDYRAQYAPLILADIPEQGEIDLVLQVSYFEYTLPAGGIWTPLWLGPSKIILERSRPHMIFEVFIIAALIAIGLYHLTLFLLRRSDPSPLYFGLFCILFAVYNSTIGSNSVLFMITGPLDWRTFNALVLIIHITSGPLFTLYIHALFPREFNRKVLNAILLFTGASLIATFALPDSCILYINGVYLVFLTCVMIYCTIVFIRALRRRREGALLVFSGYSIIIAATVNEALVMFQILPSISLFANALLLYCALQAFLLSRRFMRAFYRVERLSDELEEKNRRLLAVDRLKDEFLANTSHELRTPLNGIIGLAESLTAGATGPLAEATRRNLSMIAASGRRLAALVNDILDFSKLKEHTLDIRKMPVDLAAAADIVLTVLRPTAERKGLELKSDIPAELPPVWADENRIQQILYNLVGNAIKFTDTGGVTLAAESRGHRVTLTVSDTGIGIAPEDQARIFEAFEQADGSVSRAYGGTGLGLSITRRLVELHKGTITVESEPGRGSCFTVDLPRAETPAKSSGSRIVGTPPLKEASNGESPLPAPSGGGSTILVVDDDPVNCQVLENLLSLQGHAVVSLSGGREALDYLERRDPPALIFLDVMMPRLSGYEVARKIRERHAHTDLPIIMLTAKTQTADLAAGFESGANDYLMKPFDAVELLTRTRNHLALREAVLEGRRTASLYRELEIARDIQRSTIPAALPVVAGFDLAAAYIPAEQVGGDFYQFITIDEHRLGIIIADVSGHGIPAAIIASMATVVINLLTHQAHRPGRFLTALNRILSLHIGTRFLTAGLAVIDREEGTVCYASAGHEPMLILRKATGIVEELSARGRPIGWFDETTLRMVEAPLGPGDRVVLYTDGFTEVFDDSRNMFGSEGLRSQLAGSAVIEPGAFIDALVAHLQEWSGNRSFDDDLTIVVADILAVPGTAIL